MSTPSRLQSSQVQSAQDLTVVTTAIARLRAEHDATDDSPRDASLWLALELVAGKLGDSELRERALLSRAALTANAHWKGLLLLSLGEQRMGSGDHEAAERALEEALTLESPASFDC